MNLILVLTDACSRQCRYCYADARRARPMTRAIGERAIDFALQSSPASLCVGFFGGEPLLRFELLAPGVLWLVIWGACAAYGQQTIYVNGTAGNDDWNGLCEQWDGGTCGPKATIQAGINAAQPGDTVLVADGTYTGEGNKRLNFVSKAITVRSANGPDSCIIDCEGDGRGFAFGSGATPEFVLEGLTITHGDPRDNGGGIRCRAGARPTIRNCSVIVCSGYEGGGVYCEDSSPTLIDCTISRNTAAAGGGICCRSGEPMLSNCTISHNRVSSDGAGVCCSGSSLTLDNCAITLNTAGMGGGGFYCGGSSPTLTNCVISLNTSQDEYSGDGGGICCSHDSMPTLSNCTITQNTAGARGGGIWCLRSTPTLTNCTITLNAAACEGGGIYFMVYSSPALSNCTISFNTSPYNGGGVHCYQWCDPTLSNCTISRNTPAGIYCDHVSNPTLSDCTITQNAGTGVACIHSNPKLSGCGIAQNTARYGGGVYCLYSEPILSRCAIALNAADRNGGGVYCSHSNPMVRNCTISLNAANRDGGAVCCYDGHPTFSNCVIVQNAAACGGAAYCYSSGPTLSNCTIAANSASDGPAIACDSSEQQYPSSVTITSSVLWSGGEEVWNNDGSVLSITYSDAQGGWSGEGNIDADPLFADPDNGDYHLTAGSPCIDAGDPAFVPLPGELDMDGQMRVWDGDGDGVAVVDMGADEFGSFAYGNLNCDGAINLFDIDPFILALTDPAAYEAAYPDCDQRLLDCNVDGTVNEDDIDAFVALLVG